MISYKIKDSIHDLPSIMKFMKLLDAPALITQEEGIHVLGKLIDEGNTKVINVLLKDLTNPSMSFPGKIARIQVFSRVRKGLQNRKKLEVIWQVLETSDSEVKNFGACALGNMILNDHKAMTSLLLEKLNIAASMTFALNVFQYTGMHNPKILMALKGILKTSHDLNVKKQIIEIFKEVIKHGCDEIACFLIDILKAEKNSDIKNCLIAVLEKFSDNDNRKNAQITNSIVELMRFLKNSQTTSTYIYVSKKATNRQIHNNLKKLGFFKGNDSLRKESFNEACSGKRQNYREFLSKVCAKRK